MSVTEGDITRLGKAYIRIFVNLIAVTATTAHVSGAVQFLTIFRRSGLRYNLRQ